MLQPGGYGFTATLLNDGLVLIVGGTSDVDGTSDSGAELSIPKRARLQRPV
jgi:hypothetical protein